MIAAAQPGQVIDGRFTVIKLIGRGAMADVFEARDASSSEKVALKILREQVNADDDSLLRFEREAATHLRIRHPNVAVLLEAGLHGAAPYLVLELLSGRSLRSVLRNEGRVEVHRGVAYVWQALQGLAATHQAGVLHRDLKPANLMLQRNPDGSERVVLIDFGFASLAGQAGITRQGFVVGSLTYMAPERLRNEEIDRRSDLYAMATILYELIAGQPPFSGDDGTLVSDILERVPAPLSSHAPEVPPALDAVVARALSKLPDQRPADALELAAELAVAIGAG
jgi:serine/threonine-protein kinase